MAKNLHFLNDDKFAQLAINQFDKYSNENIYIINTKIKLRNVVEKENIIPLQLFNKSCKNKLLKLIEQNGISALYIHDLNYVKAALANVLKSERGLKLFWIFYGYDLHVPLVKYRNFRYVDEGLDIEINLKNKIFNYIKDFYFYFIFRKSSSKSLFDFFINLDFFCFWNYYDYKLLVDNFETKAKFVHFYYANSFVINKNTFSENNLRNILVNHSSSKTGNHSTVLNKLHALVGHDPIDKLVVPLSYGDEIVKLKTVDLGVKLFSSKFFPILDYIRIDDYFSLLDEITIAFFGAKRQEGGANLFYLLNNGVKIFLRNDNSLLQYFQDLGFIVFSFEDDFSSVLDLASLSNEQKLHNKQVFMSFFNIENEIAMMGNILKID